MNQVVLQIGHRALEFSRDDLRVIVDRDLKTYPIAKTPTEGMWFEVDPKAIDQKLFFEERKDNNQEWMRLVIREAFKEMRKNPEYKRKFMTHVPKKTWVIKTFAEMQSFAEGRGDHMTTWVEQALEWAQRIHNGESWETLCNTPDTIKWFKAVEWKGGVALIGGENYSPATTALIAEHPYYLDVSGNMGMTVPSVTRYV